MPTLTIEDIPRFAPQLRFLAREHRRETGGLLPTGDERGGWAFDLLVDKREINPIRFDFWHPPVGRWIEQDQALRNPIPPFVPPDLGPGHEIPVIDVPPVQPVGVIPEAPTLSLCLVAILILRFAARPKWPDPNTTAG